MQEETLSYRLARSLVRGFIRLVTRIEVDGLEKVPPSGAYMVVSNHLGRLDAALVYWFLNRPDVTLLVAEKYEKVPLFRWLGRQLDIVFIDRYNADLKSMRTALARLRQGNVLVLAPEGTRSPTGALIEGRAGSSYLAAKAGVPLIPVAITGSEDKKVYSELLRLRPARIHVLVGDPFSLPPLKGRDRDALLQEYTAEIMVRIAALLPPHYRGVYADHPRLAQLLQEQAQASPAAAAG